MSNNSLRAGGLRQSRARLRQDGKASQPILEMVGITKRFPGVLALDSVDFRLMRGEVHAIVGENGAGKSTLIKILAGAHQRDAGTVYLDGRPVNISSPADAARLGISVIYQEFTLVPAMTVAENILLSDLPVRRGGMLDKRAIASRAKDVLDDLGVDIPVTASVRSLRVAEQQIVEIAKALSRKARIIVMDEPTAALSEMEVARLFSIIHSMVEQGVSIIYISHKLDEVFRIADTITVLRDGRRVSTTPTSLLTLTKERIVHEMVGRDLGNMFPKEEVAPGDVVLEVNNLRLPGGPSPISFSVRAGEIVGVVGLMGAGQIRLARALFGLERIAGGEVKIRRKAADLRSPLSAVRAGIGLVTENRKEEGLVLPLSVARNITLGSLDHVSTLGVVSQRKERAVVDEKVAGLGIKTPSIRQLVRNLSGGNQQKVVLAKWLTVDPDVIVLCEPTRGIDVGAKVEIYRLMGLMASQGKAILLISSEVPEVVAMSDRVLVMHSGRVVCDLPREEVSQEAVMQYATGGNALGSHVVS
ncbi:MAG: sugar ABC transporter ATP-binding protein [Bacillota bacterium]